MTEKVKKLVLEKFSITRGPAIQRFPFEEGDIKIIKYYSGETLKGKPNGKGIFEVYRIDVSFAKFYKSKKFDSLWKKYSKNFLDKSRGYVLSERHVGNWKLGKNVYKKEFHPGDSLYIKPFISHNFRGNGKIIVLRIGGKTSGDAQRELSIVGKDNAERAISETTQWFDPQGKN